MSDWEIAEKQAEEIIGGYYYKAQRADSYKGGDILNVGDIVASHNDEKMLLVQVKNWDKMTPGPVRATHESVAPTINGDHVDVELWCRSDDVWRVYPVKPSQRVMLDVEVVELPTDINQARTAYHAYKLGKIKPEVINP